MDIPFVFLTSFSDKATVNEASELSPEGYLLKPFNEADIFSTLNVALTRSANKHPYFTIKIGHEVHKVKVDDLLFIMSSDKYIEIQTKTRSYLKRDGIDSFIKDNDLPGIIRVHRSYAVKTENVSSVKGSNLLINEYEIPISKTYEEAFKKAYNSL